MNTKLVSKFKYHYRAEVRPSEVRQAVYSYPSLSYDYKSELYTDCRTMAVPAVEIRMTEKDFATLLDDIEDLHDRDSEWGYFKKMNSIYGLGWISQYNELKNQVAKEAALRDRVPALKSAWEQYQFTLALVRDY